MIERFLPLLLSASGGSKKARLVRVLITSGAVTAAARQVQARRKPAWRDVDPPRPGS